MPSSINPQAYARKLVSRAIRMSEWSLFLRNTHAAIPTANAPEPRAVSTITLKVFQIPHPYASFIPLTGPRPASSRYAVSRNAISTSARSTRKNVLTTGNPKTGTFRSQRFLRASLISMAAVLIVAPSIRFPSRAHAPLLHGLSDSCGSLAPALRKGRPAMRSTDRSASASAASLPGRTLAQALAGRVFQTALVTDTAPACRRYPFRHRRGSGNSARDSSRSSASLPATVPNADQRLLHLSGRQLCIRASILVQDAGCTIRTLSPAD